ncbi:MAG: redoxin domain-containing protein [bacterium]|nr:redoxin domain-containing protein [bacterium]
MSDRVRRLLLALCTLLVAVGSVRAESATGRVVDASGAPVAGVEIAAEWRMPPPETPAGPAEPLGEVVVTDAEGRFELPVAEPPARRGWIALDPERSRGACFAVEAGTDPIVTLEPLVEVRGRYAMELRGERPSSVGTVLVADNAVLRSDSVGESFLFRVPPSRYALWYVNGEFGDDARTSTGRDVRVESTPVDVGNVSITLPRILRHGGVTRPATDGVSIAPVWQRSDSGLTPFRGATTDASGSYSLPLPVYREEAELALLALDAERTVGGVIRLDPRRDESARINLKPLARLRARFVLEGGGDPVATWCSFSVGRRGFHFIQGNFEDGLLDVSLPPGKYWLWHQSEDSVRYARRIKLPRRGRDLGTLEMATTKLAKLRGTPAPELDVTHARGDFPEEGLAGYRGKWVLIDFWGHWCGPCIRAFPGLLTLYDDYADLHDRFEILAFHHDSVDDFDELDDLVEAYAEEWWGGREFPFPSLLDTTGETVKRYGVTAWPTMVLIDPEGQVAAYGHAKQLLEDKLRELRSVAP